MTGYKKINNAKRQINFLSSFIRDEKFSETKYAFSFGVKKPNKCLINTAKWGKFNAKHVSADADLGIQ